MAKYLTEFIGTFIFVLTIGLVVCQGVEMAPLVIGCVLMIIVYMGGHVSGGHYNPAVSLAAMMRGAMSSVDLIPYWIAQVAGSLAGACVCAVIFGGLGGAAATEDAAALDQPSAAYVSVVAQDEEAAVATISGEDNLKRGFFGPAPGKPFTLTQPGPWIIEIVFTFALCLVVLNTATSTGTSGNSFYGLAIGFTIVVAAFAGGGISGGAFNPAIGIGPNVIKGTLGGDPGAMANIILHTLGPIIGGALAAVVFKIQEASVVKAAS